MLSLNCHSEMGDKAVFLPLGASGDSYAKWGSISFGFSTSRVMLEAGGDVQGLSIPLGQWHTINVLEPTVILECKDGRYEPLREEDMIDL